MIHNLHLGIFLADINTLLSWGVSKNELRNIANPDLPVDTENHTQLRWNNHIIFHNIQCQITVEFYKQFEHKNVNGKFNYASLHFDNPGNLDARKQYAHLKKDFIHALGTPTFDGIEIMAEVSYPYTEWDLGETLVILMVIQRFYEECVGEIWHNPLPVWRKSKPHLENI